MSVVIFHAFPTLLTGGFVGVDVFFVISGFLITQIVREGVAAGAFSFSGFYERRVRRLVPALAVMIAVTGLLALVVLPPGDLKNFGRSIAPAMLFQANFHFAHKVGYFAPPDDVRPLLHLWSLAVEEQFYIVWPLVIWVSAKGPRWAFYLLLGAAVALSLAADELAAHRDPMTAFYNTALRAWEPLTGAVVATFWTRPIRRVWVREAMAAAGIAAILASMVLLNGTTPFPGLAAVPACLGAGLLLQASRFGGQTAVSRALSWPPVVYLGALSYSLYLWHWPVLTFLRLGSPAEPPAPLMVGGIALSIGLSALSLRFIERPYRRRPEGGLSRRALGVATVAALAVFVGFGEGLAADEGLRHRFGGEVAAGVSAEHDLPKVGDCASPILAVTTPCVFGIHRPGPPDLVLLGDSEAEAWEAGVADFARSHGLKGQLVNIPACPPVVGVGERDASGKVVACAEHNAKVLDQVAATPRIRILVLAARWALYDQGPDADHPNAYLTTPGGVRAPSQFHALLAAGLNQALARVDAVRAHDLTILILRPTPEFPFNPPRCAERAHLVGRNPDLCLQTSASAISARQAGAEAILAAAARAWPNARLLDADAPLCDALVCRATLNGRIVFRDGNHLTAGGAQALAPAMFAAWDGPADARPASVARLR